MDEDRRSNSQSTPNNTPRTVEIPKEYQQFAKVFSEEEAKRFPPKRSCDHAIEFKKGAPDVIDCKVYPMTRVEDAALDDFIDEQIEKGYIRPSKSPYASSFFFIKKKDGKLRPVQDYRRINEWTIRNQYPLPLIDDLIRDLGGAQIFSKLDVRQGYNNIRIKEGDEHKAAFKTRRGLFEPTVMYFGLCNSPATFQSFMNEIYQPTIAKHEAQRNDNTGLHGRHRHSHKTTTEHTRTNTKKQSAMSLQSLKNTTSSSNQRNVYFNAPVLITWG